MHITTFKANSCNINFVLYTMYVQYYELTTTTEMGLELSITFETEVIVVAVQCVHIMYMVIGIELHV